MSLCREGSSPEDVPALPLASCDSGGPLARRCGTCTLCTASRSAATMQHSTKPFFVTAALDLAQPTLAMCVLPPLLLLLLPFWLPCLALAAAKWMLYKAVTAALHLLAVVLRAALVPVRVVSGLAALPAVAFMEVIVFLVGMAGLAMQGVGYVLTQGALAAENIMFGVIMAPGKVLLSLAMQVEDAWHSWGHAYGRQPPPPL